MTLPNSAHASCGSEMVNPAEWVGGRPVVSACVESDSADERLVSRFVAELAAWRAHLRFVDKLLRAIDRPTTQASALARLEATVAVGILGSGNSGSKGVWSGEGPVDALIDAAEASTTLALVTDRDREWRARFDAMPHDLKGLTKWIVEETQGESPKRLRANDPPGYTIEYEAQGRRPGRRVTGLTLAEIVGLSTVDELQRARWEGKMRAGDSAPARRGMRKRGDELLLACARAWFGPMS